MFALEKIARAPPEGVDRLQLTLVGLAALCIAALLTLDVYMGIG
jgi:hypothetical protein